MYKIYINLYTCVDNILGIACIYFLFMFSIVSVSDCFFRRTSFRNDSKHSMV